MTAVASRGRRHYRLLLVNPRYRYKHYAAQDQLSHLAGKKKMTVPLSLLIVAAATPEHYDIRIIDEESDRLPLDLAPDLVGITTLSATSERAHEIAAHYRERGAKVVMGGPYATFASEEALAHADAVVVGEAEGAWEALLADFEADRLQPTYRAAEPVEGKSFPRPRWDLVNVRQIMTCSVETSRGCPFACDFCLVNRLFGRRMRYREIDDVVEEIKELPLKRVFFIADNFAVQKGFARELVRRLEPLSISWVCQASIDVADDEDLLREMAGAGCTSILIGFESLSPGSLREMNKRQNKIEAFDEAVRRVHAAGMHALASFVVGYDTDTLADVDCIFDFFERNNILFGMLNTLSVAPGTALFSRIQEEGRLCAVEPSYRNGMFPCMHYYNFSQREILDKYFDVIGRTFDYERFRQRALRLFESGAFARQAREKVGFWERLTAFLSIVNRFVLSANADKRSLYRSLISLVKKRKIAMDQAVFVLLSVEGFNEFLRESRIYLPEVRQAVSRVDVGPWREATGQRQLLRG